MIKNIFLGFVGLGFVLGTSFGSSILSSSLLRRTSLPATTCVAQTARVNAVRFCSTLPEGLKLIEISQEGLAPWSDKKQTSHSEESKPIDVTKFCSDHERGLLYRFQSWEEIEEERRQAAAIKLIHTMFSEKLLSDQERDFFLDRIDILSKYPTEELRSYIASILHVKLRK
jgi:hypothetical protein